MNADFDKLSSPLPPGAGAPNDPGRTVIVASDAELRRRSHFRRLAVATGALGVSRRELPNVIADAIYGFKGKIVWPDGAAFEVPDIDDAFGNEGSFRWVSDFIGSATQEPRQHPQQRVLPRLRLIDLYFRIRHPERARLIAK